MIYYANADLLQTVLTSSNVSRWLLHVIATQSSVHSVSLLELLLPHYSNYYSSDLTDGMSWRHQVIDTEAWWFICS